MRQGLTTGGSTTPGASLSTRLWRQLMGCDAPIQSEFGFQAPCLHRAKLGPLCSFGVPPSGDQGGVVVGGALLGPLTFREGLHPSTPVIPTICIARDWVRTEKLFPDAAAVVEHQVEVPMNTRCGLDASTWGHSLLPGLW
jgi:hypothetical protein